MPRQNTAPASYPQAVIQQIELLAQNIAIARKRRRETQAQWAKKLGISQPTMARLERGDPSVAMATYVMCMWLIKPSMGLADLISPQADDASLELELARLQSRASKTKGSDRPKSKITPAVEAPSPANSNPEEKVLNQTMVNSDIHKQPDKLADGFVLENVGRIGNNTLHEQIAKLKSGYGTEANERTAAGLAALLAKSGKKFP